MPSYICPGLLLLSRMPMLHARILMLVQVPTMLKVPYAYAGCQRFTRQSLRLCRLLKIYTPILTLVKVPKNAKNSFHLYRLSTIHTPILMLVKVPHNAENFSACAGSQEFTRQLLCLCRLPTIHTPILTPVQPRDKSHANPYACEGSRQFKQFNT
ncbi:hypothetical protein O181_107213 [Austropuccinia psidii MF-1]|uniref:Secreted protein n=1 Tax=Austropuccinia psidii MF-1 TaxID=1389203 RepID=A0A9Q3PMM9_9BASI|nr:hypothetical protein [Austropuccinia psidii MF-1]